MASRSADDRSAADALDVGRRTMAVPALAA
ncbi:hypothetical protein JOE54_001451 [Brachybacterium tyrofermentans]